jgi:glycerate dehydrogenase
MQSLTENLTSLDCYGTTTAGKIISRCKTADILITNKVNIDRNTLQALPDLKLICITATGYNNIDLVAARELNIAVTNVSDYAKNSVAQYVFAQLLHYFSQITHHNDNSESGHWSQSPTFCFHGNGSIELAGKAIGIIGYGALGKQVANIATAFGMKVLIAERPNTKDIREGRLAFLDVVQQADILTLHCPHTEDTAGFFDKNVFEKMKLSSVFINTARGALVNNHDLLQALSNKQIAYAILDVLEQEPPPSDHLLINANIKNLKITAHIAWASQQAQQTLIELVAKNITAFNNNEQLNRID